MIDKSYRRETGDGSFVEITCEREVSGSLLAFITVGDRYNNITVSCKTYIGKDSLWQLAEWIAKQMRVYETGNEE